jgi:hypothetical protein
MKTRTMRIVAMRLLMALLGPGVCHPAAAQSADPYLVRAMALHRAMPMIDTNVPPLKKGLVNHPKGLEDAGDASGRAGVGASAAGARSKRRPD